MNETIENTALATIETTNLAVIFTERGVEAIVARIEREAREQAAALDATTAKGRTALNSLGYKVTRSKTTIDNAGKDLNESKRAEIGLVDEDRRLARARLDALKDEIIAPVEAYKAIEAERVASHEAAISEIMRAGVVPDGAAASDIAALIEALDGLHLSRNWQEFDSKARNARGASREGLREYYQEARTREDEAEAARIAAEEEAERLTALAAIAQREREERIAREAAEAARAAAEAEAARKAREAEERTQAALQAAEALRAHQEKVAAEELARAEAERDAGIERERLATQQRIAAEARRERDRISAHKAAMVDFTLLVGAVAGQPSSSDVSAAIASLQRTHGNRNWEEFTDQATKEREATMATFQAAYRSAKAREKQAEDAAFMARERQAEEDRVAAVEAERQRVAREAAAQKAEDDRQAANVAHARRINREVRDAIEKAMNAVEGSGSDMQVIRATAVVEAIVKGLIPHTKVTY